MAERLAIRSSCYSKGLQLKEIVSILNLLGFVIGERQLKRIMKANGLQRRINTTPDNDIFDALRELLQESGQLHGYRWMHQRLLDAGMNTSKEFVRLVLLTLDPEGVSLRRRRRLARRRFNGKGPNYIWHADGYDKLKPYGLCIHGCVDGFSRYIIWLSCGRTNNDPSVVLGYYVKAIEEVGYSPRILRTDMGTENIFIAQAQTFLGRDSPNPEKSHMYGKSTANQRIECFWAQLRKECIQFWINLFGHLKDVGYFTGTNLDKSLIQFCFMDMLQVNIFNHLSRDQ